MVELELALLLILIGEKQRTIWHELELSFDQLMIVSYRAILGCEKISWWGGRGGGEKIEKLISILGCCLASRFCRQLHSEMLIQWPQSICL